MLKEEMLKLEVADARPRLPTAKQTHDSSIPPIIL